MFTALCFTAGSVCCWLAGNPILGSAFAVLALLAYPRDDGLSIDEMAD